MRNKTEEEIKKLKKEHKIRIKTLKAARRSKQLKKREGKVGESRAKARTPISRQRTAASKKSRY